MMSRGITKEQHSEALKEAGFNNVLTEWARGKVVGKLMDVFDLEIEPDEKNLLPDITQGKLVVTDVCGVVAVRALEGERLVYMQGYDGALQPNMEEAKANAKLHVAAPEIVSAAVAVIEFYTKRQEVTPHIFKSLQAALRKAGVKDV